MPKKLRGREPRMKPMLFLYSNEVKIPEAMRGKLGKIITLTMKAKVVGQQLSRRSGEKERETYDLEIQKIKFPSKLEKVLRS